LRWDPRLQLRWLYIEAHADGDQTESRKVTEFKENKEKRRQGRLLTSSKLGPSILYLKRYRVILAVG
jgi:hypothetical protein